MFKEKLHNDIDKITPSAELLDRVSLMMKEEASRKKPKIYMTAVKYGSLAAAVCIITAVAIMLGNGANNSEPQTGELARGYDGAAVDMNMMAYKAETDDETEASMMPAAAEAQATEAAAEAEVGAAICAVGEALQITAAETASPVTTEAPGAVIAAEAPVEPEAEEVQAQEWDEGFLAVEEYGLCDTTAISEGYILPCENGSYLLINDSMGAVALNPENNDNSIFDGLTAGDTVRVNHGYCLESFPLQTTIYSIEKIAEGELSDIPEDALKQLEEMGWLPLTDTREAE